MTLFNASPRNAEETEEEKRKRLARERAQKSASAGTGKTVKAGDSNLQTQVTGQSQTKVLGHQYDANAPDGEKVKLQTEETAAPTLGKAPVSKTQSAVGAGLGQLGGAISQLSQEPDYLPGQDLKPIQGQIIGANAVQKPTLEDAMPERATSADFQTSSVSAPPEEAAIANAPVSPDVYPNGVPRRPMDERMPSGKTMWEIAEDALKSAPSSADTAIGNKGPASMEEMFPGPDKTVNVPSKPGSMEEMFPGPDKGRQTYKDPKTGKMVTLPEPVSKDPLNLDLGEAGKREANPNGTGFLEYSNSIPDKQPTYGEQIDSLRKQRKLLADAPVMDFDKGFGARMWDVLKNTLVQAGRAADQIDYTKPGVWNQLAFGATRGATEAAIDGTTDERMKKGRDLFELDRKLGQLEKQRQTDAEYASEVGLSRQRNAAGRIAESNARVLEGTELSRVITEHPVFQLDKLQERISPTLANILRQSGLDPEARPTYYGKADRYQVSADGTLNAIIDNRATAVTDSKGNPLKVDDTYEIKINGNWVRVKGADDLIAASRLVSGDNIRLAELELSREKEARQAADADADRAIRNAELEFRRSTQEAGRSEEFVGAANEITSIFKSITTAMNDLKAARAGEAGDDEATVLDRIRGLEKELRAATGKLKTMPPGVRKALDEYWAARNKLGNAPARE